MHFFTIPPGDGRRRTRNEIHVTANYAFSGETHCWYRQQLEHQRVIRESEMFYTPGAEDVLDRLSKGDFRRTLDQDIPDWLLTEATKRRAPLRSGISAKR
jgi:hypothetical protein